MRLLKSVSKNATSLYVIESTYIHGKNSTRIVESLGTLEELSKVHTDPIAWAKEYIASLNEKQQKEREAQKKNAEVLIKLNATKQIPKNNPVLFNCGYLFLQSLFYRFGLDEIAKECQTGSSAKYDLASILSRLIYGRILSPGSVEHCFRFSQKLMETSTFKLHDMYRALSVLAEHSDSIQEKLYNQTKAEYNEATFGKRKDRILYYDCTNYYFEIEEEDDFRQYGYSKEHRPNPIVGMGLMMDEEGIPLAFSVFPGNRNEQITLTPLEQRIETDFNHAKFVICTDSGLCGATNKLFNSQNDRAFITVQSIKKMSEDMKAWALGREGWLLLGDDQNHTYSLDQIEEEENACMKQGGHSLFYEKKFYKVKQDVLEVDVGPSASAQENKKEYINQTIYVTFSLKYRNYLRFIRNGQIERARKEISSLSNGNKAAKKKLKYRQNDFHRFIDSVNLTQTGEIAEHMVLCLKDELIQSEEAYDGFYGLATNLDDPFEDILEINKRRWEIEECFRITKDVFEARPVYLSREDRIRAHFLVCFISLVLYRYLEKAVSTPEKSYSTEDIVSQLQEMQLLARAGYGYEPAYTRTDFTDRLHQVFGFRTDTEIIPLKTARQISQKSKEH